MPCHFDIAVTKIICMHEVSKINLEKMGKQQLTKKFISQSFDEFKNQTETIWSDPQHGKLIGAKWDSNNWEIAVGSGKKRSISKLSLRLRHIKTPEIDSIVIDFHYKANDWMSLIDGTMIIKLDLVNNLVLKPYESFTEIRNGVRCNEQGFYKISKDELKKICDANTIALKVSGASSDLEVKGKGLLKFQFMCRSFYSALYDDNSYDSWINSIIPPGSKSMSDGGCFIATAALGDYNHPVVIDLKLFRDNWLLKRNWGIKLTKWYYHYGPKAARIIEKSFIIRRLTLYAVVIPLHAVTKKLK